jgi:HK97 family phage portal protein
MPWPQITPLVDEAGELLFDWLPAVPPNAGQRRRLLRQEVLFLRDRSDNGLIGVSRLRRAGSALQIAIQLQRDASLFMGQAARPGGYLAAPGKVSDSTITRLQSDWETNYAAGGKGKTAVLPEGLKWEKLSLMSAEDAQLVELRRFTVEDVARIFSVPVFLLGDPTRSTYASAKESGRQFSMQALSPWVSKLIRAFSASVLAPQYRLQIDMSGLLAADPAERWTAWQRARQAGVSRPTRYARRKAGRGRAIQAPTRSRLPS